MKQIALLISSLFLFSSFTMADDTNGVKIALYKPNSISPYLGKFPLILEIQNFTNVKLNVEAAVSSVAFSSNDGSSGPKIAPTSDRAKLQIVFKLASSVKSVGGGIIEPNSEKTIDSGKSLLAKIGVWRPTAPHGTYQVKCVMRTINGIIAESDWLEIEFAAD